MESRRPCDLASKEAMYESANWRWRYDFEFEKADKCYKELEVDHWFITYEHSLLQVKKSLGKKQGVSTIENSIEALQKENIDLIERVESLKQELEGLNPRS